MTEPTQPPAIQAASEPLRAASSRYPPELARRAAGREKRALGERFGLKAFGVNLTRLAPGAQSAFRHRHTRQEEFLYVLEGEPTLVTDEGEMALQPGMCAGFSPGGTAHHLVNRTDRDVVYLRGCGELGAVAPRVGRSGRDPGTDSTASWRDRVAPDPRPDRRLR